MDCNKEAEVVIIHRWEHIWCKPIFPYKLWKLQFGPSDQHPRGGAQRGGRGDLQKCDYPIHGRVQIVKLIKPSYPLDVDPMTQIEFFIVCTKRLVCTWYVPYIYTPSCHISWLAFLKAEAMPKRAYIENPTLNSSFGGIYMVLFISAYARL
jgi:hypothetical protein